MNEWNLSWQRWKVGLQAYCYFMVVLTLVGLRYYLKQCLVCTNWTLTCSLAPQDVYWYILHIWVFVGRHENSCTGLDRCCIHSWRWSQRDGIHPETDHRSITETQTPTSNSESINLTNCLWTVETNAGTKRTCKPDTEQPQQLLSHGLVRMRQGCWLLHCAVIATNWMVN